MKEKNLKIRAKIKRLESEYEIRQGYIADLEKENTAIYEELKDLAGMSANKADELQRKIFANKAEKEHEEKKLPKINERIIMLKKD